MYDIKITCQTNEVYAFNTKKNYSNFQIISKYGKYCDPYIQ